MSPKDIGSKGRGAGRLATTGAAPAAQSRFDQLVELVDHCTAAKRIAEALDNPFLVYLLAMTIQEGQFAMMPKSLRVSLAELEI